MAEAAEDPYMLAADANVWASFDPYGGGGGAAGGEAATAAATKPGFAGSIRAPSARPTMAPRAPLRPAAVRPLVPRPQAAGFQQRPTVPGWRPRPRPVARTVPRAPLLQDGGVYSGAGTYAEQPVAGVQQPLQAELAAEVAAEAALLAAAEAFAAAELAAEQALQPEDFDLALAEANAMEQELEAPQAQAAEEISAMDDVVAVDDDDIIWEDTLGEPAACQRAAADYSDVAELPVPASPMTPPAGEAPAEEQDDASSNGDAEEEPPWLIGLEQENDGGAAAMDAEVTGGFLDGLADQQENEEEALPQYVPRLAQYLIGHPEALITKRRKKPGKGSAKRYYAQEKVLDVMADKTVTGCWACGKLDHESQECEFKRCFICSEQGHEQSDCGMRQERCTRCRSQGHLAEFCPEQAYAGGLDNEVDNAFCSCMIMRCGQEGHLNCGEVPVSASSSGAPGKGYKAPSMPWGLQAGLQAVQALANGNYGKGMKGGGLRPGGHSAGPYGKGGSFLGKMNGGYGGCGGCCSAPAGGLLRPRPPMGAPPGWAGGAKGGPPPWAPRAQMRPRAPGGKPAPWQQQHSVAEEEMIDEEQRQPDEGDGAENDQDDGDDDQRWERLAQGAAVGGKPAYGKKGGGCSKGGPPSWRPAPAWGGGNNSWSGGGGGHNTGGWNRPGGGAATGVRPWSGGPRPGPSRAPGAGWRQPGRY